MAARRSEERTYGQWWESQEERVKVPLQPLRKVALTAMTAAGATPDDAEYLFNVRLDKALQGDHTRGIRSFARDVRSAKSGILDVHPRIEVLRETPATALIDGGPTASGLLVCRAGMRLAISKARTREWAG